MTGEGETLIGMIGGGGGLGVEVIAGEEIEKFEKNFNKIFLENTN